MSFSKYFKITEKPSEQVLELLSNTTLGTNGAKYKHLDTPKRIFKLQNPLFLNLQPKEKLLANVTICRREKEWYVRYFAFSSLFKSAGKKNSSNVNSILKRALNSFFQEKLNSGDCTKFYAYIDPNNVRSKWMSESFNFKKIATLSTQTFSRAFPKSRLNVRLVSDKKKCLQLVNSKFSNHELFSSFHITSNDDPFYIYEENGEVVAFAKFHKANWQIESLPGKNGKLLTKIIPFIPILNRIIKPKKHSFLVPEAVFVKENKSELLESFFETVLAKENRTLILWWINQNDQLYKNTKETVKWGLLDKINGVHPVELVTISNELKVDFQEDKIYTSGFDFI